MDNESEPDLEKSFKLEQQKNISMYLIYKKHNHDQGLTRIEK